MINIDIATMVGEIFAGVYLAILAAWVTRFIFCLVAGWVIFLVKFVYSFMTVKVEEYNSGR